MNKTKTCVGLILTILLITTCSWRCLSEEGVEVLAQQTPTEPQPVESDYLLGAYYMPKPHGKTHQWYLVERWNRLHQAQGTKDLLRTPLLGLYEGDNLLVMDWQIKWAVEHGLSFFIFDEFWAVSPDPDPKPNLNTSLKAFLASSNKDLMKFAVMLTQLDNNHPDQKREQFLVDKIVPYWVNNYFNQDNYFAVNSAPLVVIYMPERLGWPDQNAVSSILEKMSKKAESLTGKPIFWISQQEWTRQSGKKKTNFEWYKKAGFKGIAPYKFTGFQPAPEGEIQIREGNEITYQEYTNRVVDTNRLYLEITQEKNLYYIPCISSNFDTRTRGEDNFHTDSLSFQLYLNMLDRMKQTINNGGVSLLKLDSQYRTSESGKPLVILSTWNEWEEDTALEPGFQQLIRSPLNPDVVREDPFAVLRQVRDILTKKDNSPDYTLPPKIEEEVEAKTQWFFSPDEVRTWYIRPGATALKALPNNEAQTWIAKHLQMWSRTNIMAQHSHTVSVEMKVSCPDTIQSCTPKAYVFWNAANKPAGHINPAVYRAGFDINPDGQWHKYTIPVGINEEWSSTIEALGILIESPIPDVSITFRQIAINTPPTIPGDANGDGRVDSEDFALLVEDYLKEPVHNTDFNSDGRVDSEDFAVLQANYLKEASK